MRTLRHKLVRDLWRLRYQCLTIALLVGCGIASFVATVSAAASVQASRDAFYEEGHFADVFAHLKSAPRPVLDRLRELPGVATVEGRAAGDYRVMIEGSDEAVVAHFVSVSGPEEARLNRTIIQSGRPLEPGSSDEIVLSATFAETWNLLPGSTLRAIVNGRLAKLKVVGVAVSPEFVWASEPRTGLPDPWHFGVAWMDGDALAKATGLVGGFNDVAIQLAVGADEQETIDRVDGILEPYGGLGAVGRADQPSSRLVDQKVGQLQKTGRTLPIIFLGVAAFLLHVLLSRIVGTQREQIATLKALGYRTRELIAHYLEFALAICAFGVCFGWGLGVLGSKSILLVYARYFRFPSYLFRFDAWTVAVATCVAVVAGGRGGRSFPSAGRSPSLRPKPCVRRRPRVTTGVPSIASTHSFALSPAWSFATPRGDHRGCSSPPPRSPSRPRSWSPGASWAIRWTKCSVSSSRSHTAKRSRSRWMNRAPGGRCATPRTSLGFATPKASVRCRYACGAGHRTRTTAILGIAQGMDPAPSPGRVITSPLRLPSAGLSLSRPLGESLGVKAGDPVDIEVPRVRSPQRPRARRRARRRLPRDRRVHGRDGALAPDGRDPARQRRAPRGRSSRRRRGHAATE